MHWVLVGIIGFLTGIVAFLINICDNYLFLLKFNQFEKGSYISIFKLTMFSFLLCCLVYNQTLNDGSIFLGFLVLLGFNVLFAVAAAVLIFAVVRQLVYMDKLLFIMSTDFHFLIYSLRQLAVVFLRSNATSMESRYQTSLG